MIKKKILFFLILTCQIKSFSFDLRIIKNKKTVAAFTDSVNKSTFPMLQFSYFLSIGNTIPTGSFGAVSKQNSTAFLQGYDGFGTKSGANLNTGFYFYFKKFPLPSNHKIGINWTLLDLNIFSVKNNYEGFRLFTLSTNPGILYSYCPMEDMAIDATANLCFTSMIGSVTAPLVLMQEFSLAVRLKFLYYSISFKNGRVNGIYDGETLMEPSIYSQRSYIYNSKLGINNMSFKINYIHFKFGFNL